MKRVAIFDGDGVIIRDTAIIEYVRCLTDARVIKGKAYRRFLSRVDAYRNGHISYYTMLIELTSIYSEALTGKRVKKIRQTARRFIKENKDRLIYPHTPGLIGLFGEDWLKILVTGSRRIL